MEDYVIGTDKCLVRTNSALLEGWEPCVDIATLKAFASKTIADDIVEGVAWKGTKLPADLFKQVLGTIDQFPKMEVAFSLYYNIGTNKWAIKCPEQCGAGASVHFKDDGDDMPSGYAIIGSIHTHPEMGAFWSGTDTADQRGKYGVHFVFGLRDGKVDTHKAVIVTPTAEYAQELSALVEIVPFNEDYEPNAEWVRTIEEQTYRREPLRRVFDDVVPRNFDISTLDDFRLSDRRQFTNSIYKRRTIESIRHREALENSLIYYIESDKITELLEILEDFGIMKDFDILEEDYLEQQENREEMS